MMKKIVLGLLLNVTSFCLFSQEQQVELPTELKKFHNVFKEELLQNLIGNVISFDFGEYNGELKEIYDRDTVWKKSIKDKVKAELNKHYIVTQKYKQVSDIEGRQFQVLKIQKQDAGGLNTSRYRDVYLRDTKSLEIVIWTVNCSYNSKNIPCKVFVDDLSAIAKSFFVGKEMYFYTGYKYGISEYSAKKDHRNYVKVVCTDCEFSINGKVVYAQCQGQFFDINKKSYSANFFRSEELISPANYEEIKKKTLGSLKQKGRYHYILSKIEKPQNAMIRYGKSQEIKAEDNISRFLYEDNILSILWYGDKTQFIFSLKNKSDNSLKIIWDEASFVNDKNESSKIMHKGVRYIDASKPQSPTVIPKGTELNDIIAPIDRIRYSDGYYLLELVGGSSRYNPQLEGKQVKILLPIEIQGVVNEYIFTFDMLWVYDYPKLQAK